MALKMPTLWGFFSGDSTDRRAAYAQIEALDHYHGQPTGLYSADEHFAGRDPSQGVELCTVVEAQFSYEQLLALLGDAALGDRLETITFNALPATLTTDMWAHQYDQQPNQVLVSDVKRNWSSNGDQSDLFGLEPHFGCCTANLHQGWPKFAAHLWMASPATVDEPVGVVAAAYGPSTMRTSIGKGVPLIIRQETEYPFREIVRLVVEPGRAVSFPLRVRIPAWATAADVRVNDVVQSGVQAGQFYRITRRWEPGDVVTLRFPMAVRAEPDYQRSTVLARGPLLFSLPVEADWRTLVDRPGPADDYGLYPKSPWNYALLIDTSRVEQFVSVVEQPLGPAVFDSQSPPVTLQVDGVLVPTWTLVDHSAGPLPISPVVISSDTESTALRLVPYGSAKLRVTVFPVAWPEN